MNCKSHGHDDLAQSHKHTVTVCRYPLLKSDSNRNKHCGDIDDVVVIDDILSPELKESFECSTQLQDLCYAPNVNELSIITSSLFCQKPANTQDNQSSHKILPNAFTSYSQDYNLGPVKFSNSINFTQLNHGNMARENFYLKRIENKSIQKTGVIGILELGHKEFDDYFEVHLEKFFTPELHQFTFYHDDKNIYGLQLVYRDAWGTMGMEKETYKGKLHLSNKISPSSCVKSNLTFECDEYLKELYVDGQDQITYIKLVTTEDKIFELGFSNRKHLLVNLIAPLTRVIGVGGSLDVYLNALYFYYN